jgi:hypothetical protein
MQDRYRIAVVTLESPKIDPHELTAINVITEDRLIERRVQGSSSAPKRPTGAV